MYITVYNCVNYIYIYTHVDVITYIALCTCPSQMLIPYEDTLMLFPHSAYCSDCLYDRTQEKQCSSWWANVRLGRHIFKQQQKGSNGSNQPNFEKKMTFLLAMNMFLMLAEMRRMSTKDAGYPLQWEILPHPLETDNAVPKTTKGGLIGPPIDPNNS